MQESLPVFNSMSEIAEYLGITKVSVSLALKNSPLISDELRKQVQQLARATGFSPRKYRKQTGDSSARDPVALCFDLFQTLGQGVFGEDLLRRGYFYLFFKHFIILSLSNFCVINFYDGFA